MSDKDYFDLMQRAQRSRKLLNGKFADPATDQVKKLTKHIDRLTKRLAEADVVLKSNPDGAKFSELTDKKSEMQRLRAHYRKRQINVNEDVCLDTVKSYVKAFNARHTPKITVEGYLEADT